MDSNSATPTPKAADSNIIDGAKEPPALVEKEIVLESQLNLAVDVLTSKACTEEGLEDCTNLLLHISRVNPATRWVIDCGEGDYRERGSSYKVGDNGRLPLGVNGQQ